jgi:hypothetical protein
MHNFWRGVFTVFHGAVAGVLMATLGTIAAILALSGGSPSKVVIVICVAIGVIGIGAAARQIRTILQQQRIRGELGGLLERGRELFSAIDYKWPREVAVELLEWANSVENVLQEWKGDRSYVMLFRPPVLSNVGIILEVFPEDNPEAIAVYGKSLEGTTDPRWITSGRFENDLRFNAAHGFRKSLRRFMRHRLEVLDGFVREVKD